MPIKAVIPAVDQRVAFALDLMKRGVKGRVPRPVVAVAIIRKRFEVCEASAWESFVEAKRLLSDETLANLPAIKLEIINGLRDTIAECEEVGDRTNRVRAYQVLADITGANAPVQVDVTHRAGVLLVVASGDGDSWEKNWTPHVPGSNGKSNGHGNGHNGSNGETLLLDDGEDDGTDDDGAGGDDDGGAA